MFYSGSAGGQSSQRSLCLTLLVVRLLVCNISKHVTLSVVITCFYVVQMVRLSCSVSNVCLLSVYMLAHRIGDL